MQIKGERWYEWMHHFHHHLLHNESSAKPPTTRLTSATSALDKNSTMPVVRVLFKSANGKTREGNVLVDIGAGTTVIRKTFAKALSLQGRKKRVNIAVVGGKRITQGDSRRMKLWISILNRSESCPVEVYEIDHIIISVPTLDRIWLKSFEHLGNVQFSHCEGHIVLILGVQNSHPHAESEVRQGLSFRPVGKKTKLGWHVVGPESAKGPTTSYINFARKINLEKFYDFETLGIQKPDWKKP